ncbi:MAG: prolyl oligopeptidase family serine peptidase [Steroidobacteraceae bacterium]
MKRIVPVLASWVLLVTVSGIASPADRTPDYPVAPRDQIITDYFGTRVPAPYQWMENMQSPALHSWVAAENRLTDGYLAKIPVRGWITHRLTQLWNFPKETAPIQVGGSRIFFRRNAGLQNQSVLYVQDSPSATPRVLIDPNKLSPDGSVALADLEPSPDGRYLAYALSAGGSDWETLHVLDVSTGKTLSDSVEWVKFSNIAWTNGDNGFFYSRYPTPPKANAINQEVVNQQLYFHALGQPQSTDRLIYRRPDLPHWIIGGQVSEDGRYLFVVLVNGTAPENELYYADLGNPAHPNVAAKLEPLYTRNDAAYVVVGVQKGTLYLETTLDAPKGRVVATALSDPAPAHWRTVIPEGRGVIQEADLAGGRLIVHSQIDATSRLTLYTTDGKPLRDLPLPTLGTVTGVSARNDSNSVYFGFTSFLYAERIYRYDLRQATAQTVFAPRVGFDPSLYETKLVFYPSKDGTRVPMFIVARKDVKLEGRNPTVLYGYGGFDITIMPEFDPMLPVWLELGGVYAVANLRGGGTYGEKWHQAGMLSHKQNVFDDFAWAAKYLVAQRYTNAKRLGIQGYSNGGLLTGASITQHPELFGSAYIGHGVLDMLRYQDFSGGALWAPEYGTASDPTAFSWLHAYSPLDNVRPGTCYPPTLITTSWDDDRVVPMHEFKFTAAIQRAQACGNPILLRTTGATSHIYMPTDQEIAQTADVWAFEAYTLGVKKPPRH